MFTFFHSEKSVSMKSSWKTEVAFFETAGRDVLGLLVTELFGYRFKNSQKIKGLRGGRNKPLGETEWSHSPRERVK